jgi:hypothetical protein
MGFADRELLIGQGLAVSGQSEGEHKKFKRKSLTGSRKTCENPISSLNESQPRPKAPFFNNKQPISVGV